MSTIKIQTDYGEMSITQRKGYYYAVRTWNQRKRQVYIGRAIPDAYGLDEIAKDIFSDDREFWQKHTKQNRHEVKDTKSLPLKDDLDRIMGLAKARGEDLIASELKQIISRL